MTNEQLIAVAQLCKCQATVESSSVKEWQDEFDVKRCFKQAVKVMTMHEDSGDLQNLDWWVDTDPVPVEGKGVRQQNFLNEWSTAKFKVTSWEMIKDKQSTKIVAKYHSLFKKLEIWTDDKINEYASGGSLR